MSSSSGNVSLWLPHSAVRMAAMIPGVTTDILTYSHDLQLARTRELVMRKSGYVVETADCEETFRFLCQRSHPRMVLFCQTLDAEECSRCMSYILERDASIRTLVIFNQNIKCLPPERGALVRSSAGPLSLMHMIETLIGPGSARFAA